VLQTTHPVGPKGPGRRKSKWYENPPPLKACRFDSDLGHQLPQGAHASIALRIRFPDTLEAPITLVFIEPVRPLSGYDQAHAHAQARGRRGTSRSALG
jgi:hypothetical protein